MNQASETRIANRALTLLGSGKRILALDDAAPEAKTLLALWPDARDATLAEHPWNFAIARAALPALAAPPAFGYARAFALPLDCLRWLPPRRPYRPQIEQEGAVLLSNAEPPLAIRYVARVEDVQLWSPGFADALAYRLAAEAAEPLSADKGLHDRMMAGWRTAVGKARRQDGAATGDTGGAVDGDSEWLRARGGAAGYGWRGYDRDEWVA